MIAVLSWFCRDRYTVKYFQRVVAVVVAVSLIRRSLAEKSK